MDFTCCTQGMTCDVCLAGIAIGEQIRPTLGPSLEYNVTAKGELVSSETSMSKDEILDVTELHATLTGEQISSVEHREVPKAEIISSADRHESAKGRLRWVHADCASFAPPSCREDRPICKHYSRRGCAFADGCWFSHSPGTVKAVSNRKTRTCSGGRRIVRNEGRVAAFRALLVRKFGDRLKRGTGVLDVAGGKGELAFELLNLDGVQCTVVDPRPLQCGTFVDRYTKGRYHWNPVMNQVSTKWAHGASPDLPTHARMFFDATVLRSLHDDCIEDSYSDLTEEREWSALFSAYVEKAEQTAWTRKGLEYHEGTGPTEDDIADDSEPVAHMTDPQEVRRLFLNCSCVVGMHPDQAAEAIVDHALRCKVPFAVVPCCVYAKLFPKRKLRSGQPVTTYEDLVAYLMEKHPGVHKEVLPFEGKNTVLYWDPEAESTCD